MYPSATVLDASHPPLYFNLYSPRIVADQEQLREVDLVLEVFGSLEVASDPTPAQVGHPLARLQHEGVHVPTVTSVHAAARVRRF